MATGARFWNDRSRYYTQENNPTEEILRKTGQKSWLESCGPTAGVRGMAAVGVPGLDLVCPGGYALQPEEVLCDFLNDPRNYRDLQQQGGGVSPKDVPGNRVAAWYPFAVMRVFSAKAAFITGKLAFSAIALELQKGFAFQICLVSPGHYVTAVAFDEDARLIIYDDPWPGRFADGNGFNRPMAEAEYIVNVKADRTVRYQL